MSEDTVNPIEEVIEEVAAEQESEPATEEKSEEERVPLSALQKERRKRQEMEQELKWYKEQQQRKVEEPQQPDDSLYESATKADLGRSEEDILRKVDERNWIRNNPEKYEKVNDLLADFLKKRPNLARAIADAPNRYEEAWELLDKLSPKEQRQIKVAPISKKDAPGSPTAGSKAASLNQSVDVMSMSDKEFAEWRRAKKQAR